MKSEQTEVLVVGAGPVGLLTAVLLAEAGIQVQIIDREEGTTARSYACALHPRSMKLLHGLGLATAIIAQSRRVPTVAFYEGVERQAELKFSELGGEFPFLLVLPQSALEDILEERLREKSGIKVRWNHRLDRFQAGEATVEATVEKLAGTAMGYIVPHWETMVQKVMVVRAQFLIGADGHNSMVRQRLNLDYERFGLPQTFVTSEFTTDADAEPEVRVVLDDATTNVLWPLPGQSYRWTFQLALTDAPPDFPEKDRRATASIDQAINEQVHAGLERLIKHRAPWFTAKIREISWCQRVGFEARLAREFGEGRCWLAGDAAHQTGPVGVQSLNVGLLETEMLADALKKILRQDVPPELLAAYSATQRNQWRQLLGQAGGIWAGSETGPWVRARCDRILPCIPASGEDLGRLAGQLQLQTGARSEAANQ